MDDEGHVGYLPAGIDLEDLLVAAEQLQQYLPDSSAAGTPTAGAGEEEFTPLDLAALVAAHAKRFRQQQEAQQLREMERQLQKQQGFPRPASSTPGGGWTTMHPCPTTATWLQPCFGGLFSARWLPHVQRNPV